MIRTCVYVEPVPDITSNQSTHLSKIFIRFHKDTIISYFSFTSLVCQITGDAFSLLKTPAPTVSMLYKFRFELVYQCDCTFMINLFDSRVHILYYKSTDQTSIADFFLISTDLSAHLFVVKLFLTFLL